MTLGRYEPDRPRRSPVARILRWGLAAGVMAALALFAFQLGIEDERGRQGRLADEVARLTEAQQQAAQANAALRAQVQTAQGRLKELEAENAKLKKLLAEQLLVTEGFKEIASKKW